MNIVYKMILTSASAFFVSVSSLSCSCTLTRPTRSLDLTNTFYFPPRIQWDPARAIEAITDALRTPYRRDSTIIARGAIRSVNYALWVADIARNTAEAVEQAPRMSSGRPVHAINRALETAQAARQRADAITEYAREIEPIVMYISENGFLPDDANTIRGRMAEFEAALTTALDTREAANASRNPIDEQIARQKETEAASMRDMAIRTIQAADEAARDFENQLIADAERAATETRAAADEAAEAARAAGIQV
jgi:hypothetical protein